MACSARRFSANVRIRTGDITGERLVREAQVEPGHYVAELLKRKDQATVEEDHECEGCIG